MGFLLILLVIIQGAGSHREVVMPVDAQTNESGVSQPWPNPINRYQKETPKVNIDHVGGTFIVEVYNSLGQKVISLFEGEMEPGKYQVSWNGKNNEDLAVGVGIYFMQVQSGFSRHAAKITLMGTVEGQSHIQRIGDLATEEGEIPGSGQTDLGLILLELQPYRDQELTQEDIYALANPDSVSPQASENALLRALGDIAYGDRSVESVIEAVEDASPQTPQILHSRNDPPSLYDILEGLATPSGKAFSSLQGFRWMVFDPEMHEQRFRALPLSGDLNADGQVDMADVELVINAVGESGLGHRYDFDGDGAITGSDVLFVFYQIGQGRIGPYHVLNQGGSGLLDFHVSSDNNNLLIKYFNPQFGGFPDHVMAQLQGMNFIPESDVLQPFVISQSQPITETDLVPEKNYGIFQDLTSPTGNDTFKVIQVSGNGAQHIATGYFIQQPGGEWKPSSARYFQWDFGADPQGPFFEVFKRYFDLPEPTQRTPEILDISFTRSEEDPSIVTVSVIYRGPNDPISVRDYTAALSTEDFLNGLGTDSEVLNAYANEVMAT
jgi:hypothetical protein